MGFAKWRFQNSLWEHFHFGAQTIEETFSNMGSCHPQENKGFSRNQARLCHIHFSSAPTVALLGANFHFNISLMYKGLKKRKNRNLKNNKIYSLKNST